MSKKSKFTADDLEFALENAAGFLEAEEWPELDGGAQVAANQEAAKRIRAMVTRSVKSRARKQVRDVVVQTKKNLALVANMRAKNVSDHEIAIALGIPEDSPLLIK